MISSGHIQQIQGHLPPRRCRGERGNNKLRSHVTDPRSLTRWKMKRKEGKWSAQVTCNRSKVTYTLEDEEKRGETISSGCMWQIQGHLHPGRWRGERGNNKLRSYVTDPRSLTTWKMKRREGKSSAQVTCNRSKVTYKLEDEEERGEMISSGCMQQIQGHLQPGRWKGERGNDQLRLHAVDPRSLTSWKMKRKERKWSAQVACDRSKVTYILEDEEEREEMISSGHMQQIQGHLPPGRWRGKRGNNQLRFHVTDPRSLTPWKMRGNDQLRSHMTDPRSLTRWKMKRREGKWSAQVACNRSKVTYMLEDEEERREMISSGCMQHIQGHLQARRWRGERGDHHWRMHATNLRSLTS